VLTHIDQKNNPTMVDIHTKVESLRLAVAQTTIQLPAIFKNYVNQHEIIIKKGPVFQTAIIAATMAVKKTADVIPFCHQVPIEDCKIEISIDESLLISITCLVKTTFKTGVEMEALHGASIAALTIYDMCKALSSEIVIGQTKLVKKMGGKKPYLGRKTFALVLTGGKSQRMEGKDKALLSYQQGLPHAEYLHNLLSPYVDQVFLSARENQWKNTSIAHLPTIDDVASMQGPLAGIYSAFNYNSDVNWLVVACDLPFVNVACIEHLFWNFESNSIATCYKNETAGFPEALCAIYTPAAKDIIFNSYFAGTTCPVKVLKNNSANSVAIPKDVNLANINLKVEWEKMQNEIN